MKHPCRWGWVDGGMRHKMPPGCQVQIPEEDTYCPLHKQMALERMYSNTSPEAKKIKQLQKEIAERIK